MQTRNSNKKHIPAHAYSFSAGILFGVAAAGLHFFREDQRLAQVSLLATVGFVSHGIYDLHKEGRLSVAIGLPFFKRHAAKIGHYVADAFETTKTSYAALRS